MRKITSESTHEQSTPLPDLRMPFKPCIRKIYLTNDSYKSVIVNNNMSVSDLASLMAEKLNMDPSCGKYLDIFEIRKESTRKLKPDESIIDVILNWPVVFGKSGLETYMHSRLMCKPQRYAPPDVQFQYWMVTSVRKISTRSLL